MAYMVFNRIWTKIGLPNALTVLRVILAAAFLLLIKRDGLVGAVIASSFFLLAAVTDFYDGYFARKYALVSNFGKIMDPIADKFLILAAFYIFTNMAIIPFWMFAVIFVREVGLTALRLMAMARGEVLAAERWGKYKTVSQMFSVGTILGLIILQRMTLFAPYDGVSRQMFFDAIGALILICMYGTVALTVVSGGMYVWNNRRSFRRCFSPRPGH